jgi:hypothetical protein
MEAAVVAAVIAALASVLATFVSVFNARQTSQSATEIKKLEYRLQSRREQEQRDLQTRDLMDRYRVPLVHSAYDFQSRLFNIVAGRFLKVYLAADQEFAVNSTLFAVAEFLGWQEVIRREVRFLDQGGVEQNQALTAHLDAVRDSLASDAIPNAKFRLFRHQQRAIGELMVRANAGGDRDSSECMGFAEFSRHMAAKDDNFVRWFAQLQEDIINLACSPASEHRLIVLQGALIDLVRLLDPDALLTPKDQRKKLSEVV